MKIKVLIVIYVFYIMFLFSALIINSNAASYNEHTTLNTNIDGAFDDDCVVVILDQSISEVNKKHDKSFFGNIEIEAIEDLTYNENWNSSSGKKRDFKQVLKIKLKSHSKEQVLEAVKILERIDKIICASPNYYGIKGITIEDPYYEYQWALNGVNGINVSSAWDFSIGVQDVKVGILDTGIASHDDLNGNLVSGISYIDMDTNDIDGHGTNVAGIVGAVGNNFGISGVCRKISLVPIKFNGYVVDVQSALTYAENNGIKIVNMSWWNFSDEYQVLRNAIESFDGLFVCIAGNAGENIANIPNYPASYHLSNMLVVGSIDSLGNICYDSNYGNNVVDIYAPGEGTLTTTLNNGYAPERGTSIAGPHVTGVAALLLSINPNLTTSQLKTAILEGADDIVIQVPTGPGGSLENQYVKKLNAYGAVKYVLTNRVATPYTLNNSITTINISHTALANNDYFTNDNGFYKLNVSSSTQYDFNVSSSYPIDVLLYDSNYNQLTYTDLNNSSSIVKFNKSLSSGTYYLRVKYQSDTQAGTIYTSINCHSYTDHYVWKNLTEHKSYCACGEYTTSFHVVSPDAFQGGLLAAPCLLCNGPASFGGIIHDGIGNYPYTLNGSFILPNGIIVLEEADMEAYLNGTLIFINPNENIDRSENFIPCIVKRKDDYKIDNY